MPIDYYKLIDKRMLYVLKLIKLGVFMINTAIQISNILKVNEARQKQCKNMLSFVEEQEKDLQKNGDPNLTIEEKKELIKKLKTDLNLLSDMLIKHEEKIKQICNDNGMDAMFEVGQILKEFNYLS